jgi:hypothetical protein
MSPVNIYLADSRVTQAVGRGRVRLEVQGEDGMPGGLTLKEVWYVPGLDNNLLSVRRATDNGVKVVFVRDVCEFRTDRNGIVALADKTQGVYFLRMVKARYDKAMAASTVTPSVWHKRLGHTAPTTMDKLVEKGMVTGMEAADVATKFCEDCVITKMTRQPYPHRGNISKAPLDLVHTDVCGPIKPETSHHMLELQRQAPLPGRLVLHQRLHDHIRTLCKAIEQVPLPPIPVRSPATHYEWLAKR